jgi:hypothetical protein
MHNTWPGKPTTAANHIREPRRTAAIRAVIKSSQHRWQPRPRQADRSACRIRLAAVLDTALDPGLDSSEAADMVSSLPNLRC